MNRRRYGTPCVLGKWRIGAGARARNGLSIPTLVGAELQTAPLSGAPQAMSVGLLSCDAGLNVDSHRYGFAVLGRTTHPFTLGILQQLRNVGVADLH